MVRRINRRLLLQRSCLGGLALMSSSAVGQTRAPALGMKITGIKAHQPTTPGSPPDWRTQLGQIVVEVQTESGLTGIGVGGGGAASIHVIHTVLRDLLLGRDASTIEELHHEMNQHLKYHSRTALFGMG